jgi:hypothetical protein
LFVRIFLQQAEIDLENIKKLEEAQMTIRMSLRDPKKKDKKQSQASTSKIFVLLKELLYRENT